LFLNHTVVDNTPQVHKQKASFKLVKSVTSKQGEFGATVSSGLPFAKVSMLEPTATINFVKSVESPNSVQKQISHFAQASQPCTYVISSAEAVKPMTASAMKRHA